jgi:DNA-binding beta-propeller fold protein YncE
MIRRAIAMLGLCAVVGLAAGCAREAPRARTGGPDTSDERDASAPQRDTARAAPDAPPSDPDLGTGPADVAVTGGSTPTDGAAPDAAAGPDLGPGGPARLLLVAGGGSGGDGMPAVSARLGAPFGAAVDPMTGDLYLVEAEADRVRRIDAAGIITTVVGAGAAGAGGKITLTEPHDLEFQPGTRQLYIADTRAMRVIRYDAATGEAVVFAGAGGLAGGALTTVFSLAFAPGSPGPLYLTDTDRGRILAIDTSTFAVTTAAMRPRPRTLAVDAKKNLYVVGVGSHVVERIDPGGALTVVVGSGRQGSGGDGGPALAATLNAPKKLAIDSDDSLVIADTENHLIRRYLPASKTIVRVAGTGATGTGGVGGPPAQAALNRPHGVAVGPDGTIYISDSSSQRVLKVTH